MRKRGKIYSLEEVKRSLERYCLYRDRCHKEVESKLHFMELKTEDFKDVVLHLEHCDFLNENRFARSYVRGKFRINGYGRIRIIRELRFRNITDDNIRIGLKEIEDDLYKKYIEDTIFKRMQTTDKEDRIKNKKTTIDFLLRKGYEYDLILQKFSDFEN